LCLNGLTNCSEINKGKPVEPNIVKDNPLLEEDDTRESIAKNTTAYMKGPNTNVLKEGGLLNEDDNNTKVAKVPDDLGDSNNAANSARNSDLGQ